MFFPFILSFSPSVHSLFSNAFQLFIRSFIHSFIHWQSFTHYSFSRSVCQCFRPSVFELVSSSFSHSVIHSFVLSFVRSFTSSHTQTVAWSFTPSINHLLTPWVTYAPTHSLTFCHPLMNYYLLSLCLLLCSCMQTFTHSVIQHHVSRVFVPIQEVFHPYFFVSQMGGGTAYRSKVKSQSSRVSLHLLAAKFCAITLGLLQNCLHNCLQSEPLQQQRTETSLDASEPCRERNKASPTPPRI